jgi:hypothetical protein
VKKPQNKPIPKSTNPGNKLLTPIKPTTKQSDNKMHKRVNTFSSINPDKLAKSNNNSNNSKQTKPIIKYSTINSQQIKTFSNKALPNIANKLTMKDIKVDSNNRLNEYSNIFGILGVAMTDLKSSIDVLVANEYRRSFVNSDLLVIKQNFGFIERMQTDEGCDFSETHMYENVTIKKPDLYKNKINLLKKPSETGGSDTNNSLSRINIDNTCLEYESMLTEENNLNSQNNFNNLKHFNKAKVNLLQR